MTDLLNSLWQGAAITLLIWLMLKVLPALAQPPATASGGSPCSPSRSSPCERFFPPEFLKPPRATIITKSDGQITPIPAAPHAPDSSVLIMRSSPAPHAPLAIAHSTSPRLPPVNLPAHLITQLTVGAWLILSITLLTRLAYSYQALRRLKRTAIQPSESLRSRFTHIAGNARIHRPAQLLISPEIDSSPGPGVSQSRHPPPHLNGR